MRQPTCCPVHSISSPTQPAALSDKFAGSGIRDSLLSESILAQTDREKVKRRSQYTSTDSSRRSTSTISHSVSFRLSCTDVDHLTPTIRPSPYAKPKDRGVVHIGYERNLIGILDTLGTNYFTYGTPQNIAEECTPTNHLTGGF